MRKRLTAGGSTTEMVQSGGDYRGVLVLMSVWGVSASYYSTLQTLPIRTRIGHQRYGTDYLSAA